MKIVFRIILPVLIVAGLWYVLFLRSDVTTSVRTDLIEYKSVDKLFTSFAYVPLLDLNYGYKTLSFGERKKVLLGYCLKNYEVGIGYDNTTELMKKYRDYVCNGMIDSLPQPIILSTNATSSNVVGKYNREKCDEWDMVSYGDKMSKHYVQMQLIQDGHWESISKKSKNILAGFIRIYCP